MQTKITWRGVEYVVDGGWDSESGSHGPTAMSVLIDRADGKPIRGARMHPGMVQTGISRGLARRAKEALRAQMQGEARQ